MFVHRYQPRDAQGNPVGGEQVVEGATIEEVLEKVAQNHVAATAEIHRLRKIQVENDKTVKPDAQRAKPVVQFKPKRELTPVERLELARDITDPSKIDSAIEKILEAKMGATPDQVVEAATNNQQNLEALRAQQEATAFAEQTPEFYRTQDNVIKLATWVQERGLAFTVANLREGFQTLSAAALLQTAPPVTGNNQENANPDATPAVRIDSEKPSVTERPTVAPPEPSRSSVISRNQASQTPPRVTNSKLTRGDIARMSSAEYKQRMTDPKFRELVDKL